VTIAQRAEDLGNALELTRYFIRGRTYTCADPQLQEGLARVYGASERPRCMCVPGGVEMYIAKHADYVVKRMPDTGHLHHPTCPSFEPEPGTSGLGELIGEAIIERSPDQVEVRTDFAVPDPAEVRAPRKRMSLRALLHFLYERAGFNRWYPAMEGRRNQGVLHKYLLEASKGVLLKGAMLDERLYVPEPFRPGSREEIAARRRRKLALLLSPQEAVQFKMAIVVGVYNGSEPTSFGRRISVRHMPDVSLCVDGRTWDRVERSCGAILQARDADVACRPRVMMAALIYAKGEHVYQVDTVSMMLITESWIPLDGLHELPLIETLQHERRAFLKPLKYDSRFAAAFPNVLLLDCGKAPVPMHVVSPFADAKERAIKEKAVANGGSSTWVWYAEREMPALPVGARSREGESRRHALMAEDPPRVGTGDGPDGNTVALAASRRAASTDLAR
jgi:Protein of unknown function (DUF1173)